jgi:hypothetical protein
MTKSVELRLIHSAESLENGIARFSLAYWRKRPDAEIISSLKPGQSESLKIKSDGRILNGNVRCKVLIERNVDINKLEREIV